jgi:hypothetical protein
MGRHAGQSDMDHEMEMNRQESERFTTGRWDDDTSADASSGMDDSDYSAPTVQDDGPTDPGSAPRTQSTFPQMNSMPHRTLRLIDAGTGQDVGHTTDQHLQRILAGAEMKRANHLAAADTGDDNGSHLKYLMGGSS